jgi:hypothetical protein
MRARSCCALLPAVLGLSLVTTGAYAEEAAPTGVSNEARAQLQELAALTTKRTFGLYELAFQAVALDEIVVRDRLGGEKPYSYVVFRLRNQAALDASKGAELEASRYAEVLKALAAQYEQVKVSAAGGGKLSVGDETNPDNVVLQRQDLSVQERAVRLTFVAYDRFVKTAPAGLPTLDRGNERVDIPVATVRAQIEDRAGRHLLLPEEIDRLQIPPYDPNQRSADGSVSGEVYGVAIFDRFDVHADRVAVEVHGLSNKMRVVQPASETGKPENYLATRILRRTMVLDYRRVGDEFHRADNPFRLNNASYRWIETFQRLDQRRTMALARFYMANDGAMPPETQQEFWSWYEQSRATQGDKLPDLKPQAGAAGQ